MVANKIKLFFVIKMNRINKMNEFIQYLRKNSKKSHRTYETDKVAEQNVKYRQRK